MAVAKRVGQPLEHQHAGTLAPPDTVGSGGVGLAAAVDRQPTLTAELDEAARRRVDRRATGQRQRALALTQRLTSQMQRHQ